MKEQKKVSSEEFEPFLYSHLEGVSDMEAMILKGHILTEYAMNNFIEKCSIGECDLRKANFSYSTKINVCEILGLFKHSKILLLKQSINAFNRYRNSIAHTIGEEIKEHDQLIKLFKKISDDVQPVTEGLSDMEIIREFIVATCGLIEGIGRKIIAYRELTNSMALEAYQADEARFTEKFNAIFGTNSEKQR